MRAAEAGGAVVQLARLREPDEIVQCPDLAVVLHHQHVGQAGGPEHRRQLALEVERHLVEQAVHRAHADRAIAQRVAVLLGLGDGIHSDIAVGARRDSSITIGWPRILLASSASRREIEVGAAAGRRRHDQADRPGRIVLRQRRRDDQARKRDHKMLHGVTPCSRLTCQQAIMCRTDSGPSSAADEERRLCMSERDPFKARLRRRDVMFGCFVGQPSPAIAEMVGYAGFDYVIIDLEHGPTGLETLENMLRAAQAAGAASLVRLPSPAQADVLRVLDAGADGILVPHVESARRRAGGHRACLLSARRRSAASARCRARRVTRSSARRQHLAGANAAHRGHADGRKPRRGGSSSTRSSRSTASTGSSSARTISPRRSAMSATATIRTCRRRSATSCGARRQRGCALATLARSLSDVKDVPRAGLHHGDVQHHLHPGAGAARDHRREGLTCRSGECHDNRVPERGRARPRSPRGGASCTRCPSFPARRPRRRARSAPCSRPRLPTGC